MHILPLNFLSCISDALLWKQEKKSVPFHDVKTLAAKWLHVNMVNSILNN